MREAPAFREGAEGSEPTCDIGRGGGWATSTPDESPVLSRPLHAGFLLAGVFSEERIYLTRIGEPDCTPPPCRHTGRAGRFSEIHTAIVSRFGRVNAQRH